MSNPLVESVREWQSPEFKWTDATIRMHLSFNHEQSPEQIDEILAEANAPSSAPAPSNGHSTPHEIASASSEPAITDPIEPSSSAAIPMSGMDEPEPKYLEPTDALGYLRLLFEPGDYINLPFIHQTAKWTDARGGQHAKTDDNFMTLADALQPSIVAMIAEKQDEGWNSYVAMNAFTLGLNRRRKKDIKDVRTVYIEFDENGAEGLAKIDSDIDAGIIPEFDFILESSPNKFYVVWRVEGFSYLQQEALNKALQMRFGSDPRSVDAARVLRLPGTRNLKPKYNPTPVVKIYDETAHERRWTPADFKIEIVVPPPVNRAAAPDKVQSRMAFYEEACENAGADAGDLIAKDDGSYSYTVACPNYEEHTTGSKFDSSVWISPSGAISFRCFHSHCEDKDWKTCYRPWLEEQAKQNGFEDYLKFGDVSEIEATELVLTQAQPYPPLNPSAESETEQYAMTPEEYAAEIEKDYPVIPLVTPGGPTWDDEIMYGVLGDIVRKACASSEAHPAGVYLDFIVSLGNIFGRSAYFMVDSKRHYTNEFMVRVGATSKSRKGTGRAIVNSLLSLVAADWYSDRVLSGLSSAEAIINEVRDSRHESVPSRKKGEISFQTILVPGVNDKRLYVREDEIANVFWLISKKESRADSILRDAWDGVPLGNIVKGKSQNGISNSAKCTEPHISISGDTTRNELIRRMPDGAAENGFGNRFIWCYVQLLKRCANGSPPLDWTSEIIKLHQAIEFAKQQRYVPLSNTAAKMFKLYYMDSSSELTGLAGKMTDRAMPHIRRIAMILALVDMCAVVESKHMKAAIQLWGYCQESAEYIFAGTTKDQSRIVAWVRNQVLLGPVTVAYIREGLFQRNRKVDWVRAQVTELVRMGKLVEANGILKPV